LLAAYRGRAGDNVGNSLIRQLLFESGNDAFTVRLFGRRPIRARQVSRDLDVKHQCPSWDQVVLLLAGCQHRSRQRVDGSHSLFWINHIGLGHDMIDGSR